MSWEAINGVTGIISATAAVISVAGIVRGNRDEATAGDRRNAQLSMYVLFCSGWILCVIAWNWYFEPFGSFLSDRELNKLYAAMLSAPAALMTFYAFNRLKETGGRQREQAKARISHREGADADL